MLFWSDTLWKSRPGEKRREESYLRRKPLSKRMNELFESMGQNK